MQKRTREIIALIMLIVLGIAGIGAMTWYILIGHNWNVAATNIDDHIGTMKGYTVILYEGTQPTLSERLVEAAVKDEASRPQDDALDSEASDEGSGNDEAPDDSSRDAAALSAASSDIVDSRKAKGLSVSQAVASYHEKDAQTVIVHLENLDYYEDPIIVVRNGKRIAIFLAAGPRPDLAARVIAKELRRYDIDIAICIVDDLAAAERGMGNVTIAICTDPEAIGENRYVRRTYLVGTPYIGQIGAVLIAPSGFISSKTLDAL